MANELTTNQTGKLVLAMEQHAIGELLQPLIREIHLFDSFVAGTTHLSDPSVLEEIKVGDQLSPFARTTNSTATRSSSSRQAKRNSDMSRRRTTSSLPACWTPARCWLPRSRESRRKEALPK